MHERFAGAFSGCGNCQDATTAQQRALLRAARFVCLMANGHNRDKRILFRCENGTKA